MGEPVKGKKVYENGGLGRGWFETTRIEGSKSGKEVQQGKGKGDVTRI